MPESKRISIVDGLTNQTTTIQTGGYVFGLNVNTVTNKIYVANAYIGKVSFIDAKIQFGAVANCLAVLCFNLSLRQGDPAGGNERGDGLFYRLKAGKSGAVSKTLPAFLNGDAGATHNVSPRGFCIALL